MKNHKFKQISKDNSVALSIEIAKRVSQNFEYDRTNPLDRNQQRIKYFVDSFELAYREINGLSEDDDF